MLLYASGLSEALTYAVGFLKAAGIPFTEQIDKASHILLPIPSSADQLQDSLSAHQVVIGGNLDWLPAEQARMDLLQEEAYLAPNAMLTAHCALRHILPKLPITLEQCKILVIGWGRIGKCLCKLLSVLGATVTVAARNGGHRAMVQALGYNAVNIAEIAADNYRVVINTVPAMILPDGCAALKIDLASRPGIGGGQVDWARGLPGKEVPESAGRLMAQVILCKLNNEVCP